MKILALIQARMGSSRLPGKVLSPILGKPMLQWQIERLRRSKMITQTIIATSTLEIDDPIADFCKANHFACFRGSEDNVLDRFYQATLQFLAPAERSSAILLRLTGDCPLVDPESIDQGISQYLEEAKSGCRYFGYDGDLPDGMDFEVFSWEALDEAHRLAQDSFEKEHVTPFMWRNPKQFGLKKFTKSGITPGLRFSVDYAEDRDLVAEILKKENASGRIFGMKEISDLLTSDSRLSALNAKIIKNEGLIITSLKSEPYKTGLREKSVSKYGVAIPEGTALSVELLEWAERIGIDVWSAQSNEIASLKTELKNDAIVIDRTKLPPGWIVFQAPQHHWQKALFELSSNPKVQGILLETNERGRLAELLMFLCYGRFGFGEKV